MTPQEFVASLRARGVTLSVKNNRLRLDPGVTWRLLTVDEAQCLAEDRATIKDLVNEPIPPRAPTEHAEPAEPAEPATPEPPPPPPPKPHVYSVDAGRFINEQDLKDAGVVGTDQAAYERAEVWLRDQARERRTQYATGVMYASVRRGTHGGYRG